MVCVGLTEPLEDVSMDRVFDLLCMYVSLMNGGGVLECDFVLNVILKFG